MSTTSSSTAFRTGLEARDIFLGDNRCVVCGAESFQRCHIILPSEQDIWTDFKRRGWISNQSKNDPANEPRNGLILCHNDQDDFNQYRIFIRYDPLDRVFIFVNYCGRRSLDEFHGKAIAIDIDHYAPFPFIFIVHEMRVRGRNPFRPIQPDLPDVILWQDWLISDDLLLDIPNPTNELFKRFPPGNGNDSNDNGGETDNSNNDTNERNLPRRSSRPRKTRQHTKAGTSPGTRKLELIASTGQAVP